MDGLRITWHNVAPDGHGRLYKSIEKGKHGKPIAIENHQPQLDNFFFGVIEEKSVDRDKEVHWHNGPDLC